jgi:P-type Ca2+ transporter type 2C
MSPLVSSDSNHPSPKHHFFAMTKPKKARRRIPYSRLEICSWQSEEAAERLSALWSEAGSSPHHHLSHGWSSPQVPTLRSQYGVNRLSAGDDDEENERRRLFPKWLNPILAALLSQLKEPLILMLLGSATISVLLGNAADAASIALALLIVSLVAAVQEYRSEAALEKLADLVPPTCTVLRDGHVHDAFLAKLLVVGDLVLLSTGDRIPADCRVVDSVELMVDESSLTGENKPTTKTGKALDVVLDGRDLSPTDQENIVFAGTLVTAGRGRALVIAVGEATEFGKISLELEGVSTRKSPLQLKIDDLSKRLAMLSSIAIVAIAIWGWAMGRPLLETLTVAVSLAVAAIPEGLPICVTVTLALGVLRMAKRNAIVKKLHVVESLGCTTVVASDKTGTLTQNEMTVRAVFMLLKSSQRRFGFTGEGYRIDGRNPVVAVSENDPQFLMHGANRPTSPVDQESPEYKALKALLQVGCLCNNATMSTETEGSKNGSPSGQPTEIAILVAAAKAGVLDPRPQYQRIQEIPFSSERKCMEVRARPVSGIHASPAFESAYHIPASENSPRRPSFDGSLYFVKGMPEKIVSECAHFMLEDGLVGSLTDDDILTIIAEASRMSVCGLRVLALAYGVSATSLVFGGLVAMEDPPRAGVRESVRHLRNGGVKVMMITGDSKETALAVAERCGILGSAADASLTDLWLTSHHAPLSSDLEEGSSTSLGGPEIDKLSIEELAVKLRDVRVCYRMAPNHKLALVRALHVLGEVVTGTKMRKELLSARFLPFLFTLIPTFSVRC